MVGSLSKAYRNFIKFAAFSLAALAVPLTDASELAGQKLPAGWTPMSVPAITGNFLGYHKSATALLVKSAEEKQYGLAVLPSEGEGRRSRIVTKFKDIGANPPELAILAPGVVHPVCHNGGRCKSIKVETEAISLCFGEASCEVIYFDGKLFHTVFVTD